MRITRSHFIAGSLAAGSSIAGLSNVLAAVAAAPAIPNGEFYFFWRPGGAIIIGGMPAQGHIGFAYQSSPYEFVAGSVENPRGDLSPEGKGFWLASTPNAVLQMGAYDNVHANPLWATRYDFYVRVQVPNANPVAAREELKKIAKQMYVAPGKDCLDAVRAVYKAYGGHLSHYLDTGVVSPNTFMEALHAGAETGIIIPWPRAAVDASLYVGDRRRDIRDDIVGGGTTVVHDNLYPDFDSSAITPLPPIWRSSIVLRKGHMVLYGQQDCDPNGPYYVMTEGEAKDVKSLPWDDQELRSYCVSATYFDPKSPPVNVVAPRFQSYADSISHESGLKKVNESGGLSP